MKFSNLQIRKNLFSWLDFGKSEIKLSHSSEKVTLLALSHIGGVGYWSIRKIYSQIEGIENIWDYTNQELHDKFEAMKLKNASKIIEKILSEKKRLFDKAINTLKLLDERKISLILKSDDIFPARLRIINDSPLWLFVEGNIDILSEFNIIAIVGTRKPSDEGLKLSEKVSSILTNKGNIILSGLAKGIDSEAHKANISLKGKSIAILGTGINHIFPASSARERKGIIDNGGAVISEYFPDENYSRRSFYWRNRLQSGLAYAIIPIEFNKNSGTEHTINFAAEHKKPIYGVFDSSMGIAVSSEVEQILNERGYKSIDIKNNGEKLFEKLNQHIHSKSGDKKLKSNIDYQSDNNSEAQTQEGNSSTDQMDIFN